MQLCDPTMAWLGLWQLAVVPRRAIAPMQQRLASQHRHEVTEDGHGDIIACHVLTSLGRQSASLLVTFCVPATCVGNDWEDDMSPVTLTAPAGSFHDDNSQDHCAE
jgi:hypothetical protein